MIKDSTMVLFPLQADLVALIAWRLTSLGGGWRVMDAEFAVQRLQVQQEQETNDLRKKFDAQREVMQQQSFFVRKAYGTAAKWSWWFRQHSIKVIVGDETSFMRITSTLEMWLYASRRLVGASKFI